MSDHLPESQIPTLVREHIWLVALYEHEARANELLDRLSAIGIDLDEATTLRVEVDSQQRGAKYTSLAISSSFSVMVRSELTGALIGGALALFLGLFLYFTGSFALPIVSGLFHHALFSVLIGAAIGALLGALFGAVKQKKISRNARLQIPQLASEGFLVAVKMSPLLAERAEEIARSLGAKEILL